MTVSEVRKLQGDPRVRDWIARHAADDLYLSVLTFGEIARGIARVRDADPGFARTLAAWLEALRRDYGDRTLPFDADAAIAWGALTAKLGRQDIDTQIAATALVHDLTVVTRNARRFAAAGVRVVDPWSDASAAGT